VGNKSEWGKRGTFYSLMHSPPFCFVCIRPSGMEVFRLCVPLPTHLGTKFICVGTHSNVWKNGFLGDAMDRELDTSSLRRVYDSGFLVVAEGLSLWSLEIIYEELLLVGFCANVQLGFLVSMGDFFGVLIQRIVDSNDF